MTKFKSMISDLIGVLVCLIAIAFLWADEAEAGEWKPKEQAIVSALIIADWAQTRDIARRLDRHEMNLILGRNPSINKVNKYFALSLIAYNIAAYNLNPKWSRRLSISVGVMQGAVIANNLSLGVKFDF